MSQNQPGARELKLRVMRETAAIFDGHDFLNRTKDMSPEDLEAARRRAMRAAKAPTRREIVASPARPLAELTESDKAVIAELRKAGADKESIVRRHGAKIKPRAEDNPMRKPPMKKIHPADLAHAAAIALANSFSVSLLHDGTHETHDGFSSIDDARAKGIEMENATGNARRHIVYAITKDGRSFMVPPNYQPPTTAEDDMKPNTATKAKSKAKTAKAPRSTERRKTGTRPAAVARPAGNKSRYDWKDAEANAAKGIMPPKLDFSAETHTRFRPKLAEVEKMAAEKDVAGLKKFKWEGFVSSSPKAILRWRDLYVTALTAKAE